MRKKAQGLSMNVIIIAAIALIVLVVMVAIFTGRMGNFARETDSCERNKGMCLDASDPLACIGTYDSKISKPCYKLENSKTVVDTDKMCCISITS